MHALQTAVPTGALAVLSYSSAYSFEHRDFGHVMESSLVVTGAKVMSMLK